MSRPSRSRWYRPAPGSLGFQLGAFLLVGGVQVLADTAVFVALSSMGLAVPAANVAGRLVGASLGFVLNGRVTFASPGGHGMDRYALMRFAVLWLVLTAIGSVLLVAVEQRLGLTLAWVAKPVVEAMLATLGFLGMKFFVFRHRR